MDTEALRLFVLAADMLNISAAGRTLGLAPAVASARLAKLERAVGADLLHRSTRKVAVSIEGRAFLPFAREMLAQEQAALAALGRGGAGASGLLRFAAPSSFAQLYVAPIAPDFLERHPGVSLDLRLSDQRVDLIDGSFDLALRNAPVDEGHLVGRRLAADTRILCASPEYLSRRGTPSAPDELLGHALIAFQTLTPRPLLGPDGRDGRFDPRGSGARIIVDDGLAQRAATLAGGGVSANALWSVADDLRSGRLVRVLPTHVVDDGAALWLVYPKSNVLTPKVRVFIDFLVERIGRRPPWERA